jgi:hypothetical protein
MVFTKFSRVTTNALSFIFDMHHFYFDKMKLFMIESESLLERKFRGVPGKKDWLVGKISIDSRE